MREIFAPISTILYILSLIYQLPQNQISRIAPLLGWQACVGPIHFMQGKLAIILTYCALSKAILAIT